jgi:hypothetical protein
VLEESVVIQPLGQVLGHPYQSESEQELSSEMPRINDLLLNIPCYIYGSRSDAENGVAAGGTGFLVAVRLEKTTHCAQIYAVTNKHIVRYKGFKRPAIRTNRSSDGAAHIVETEQSDWVPHPTYDLAVYKMGMVSPIRITYDYIFPYNFLTEEILKEFDIGPGDETFLVGRFVGHDGKQRNTPAVRFGNISMMPTEPIHSDDDSEQRAFLVECRSISGFSGSPVFVWIPPNTPRPPHGHSYPTIKGPWLLGVDCGHFRTQIEIRNIRGTRRMGKADANSAMAVVIPAWRLYELLCTEQLIEERKLEDEELQKIQSMGIGDRS